MSQEAREGRKVERAKERASRRMKTLSNLAAEIEKPEVDGFTFRYEPRSDDGTCPFTCCTHREIPLAHPSSSLSFSGNQPSEAMLDHTSESPTFVVVLVTLNWAPHRNSTGAMTRRGGFARNIR
jgi:hypothetical protein